MRTNGPIANRADLIEFRSMLVAVREKVHDKFIVDPAMITEVVYRGL